MTDQVTTAPTAGAIDRAAYLEPSPYESDDGHLIGRHPRQIGAELLRHLPAPQAPMKAIRAKCLDCCVEQPGEVRKCVAISCALWPYRMGFSPYHAKSTATKNDGGLEGGFSTATGIVDREAD